MTYYIHEQRRGPEATTRLGCTLPRQIANLFFFNSSSAFWQLEILEGIGERFTHRPHHWCAAGVLQPHLLHNFSCIDEQPSKLTFSVSRGWSVACWACFAMLCRPSSLKNAPSLQKLTPPQSLRRHPTYRAASATPSRSRTYRKVCRVNDDAPSRNDGGLIVHE